MAQESSFQVISLTEAAAHRVAHLLAHAGRPVVGLRIGLKKGGCAGMSYTLDLVDEKPEQDEVVEDKGVTIFVDSKAVLFLLGTQMDVHTDKFSSTFVFNNPNQTAACGCGESVALIPAHVPASDDHAHAST